MELKAKVEGQESNTESLDCCDYAVLGLEVNSGVAARCRNINFQADQLNDNQKYNRLVK